MNIAVTAASGRLAHAIFKHLSKEVASAQLVAVARSPERVRVPAIQRRAGDYESVAQLQSAFEDIDTVVLVSAPVGGPLDRVLLHRNAIEAARRAGVRHLIYTSVIGSDGEADTLFAATQQVNRQTEADLKQSALQWTVARNGLYLDLDIRQIKAASAVGIYANAAGHGRCPYISIDELGYALAKLAVSVTHSGATYNLVGESKTQAELVELANELFGLKLRYEEISDDACIEKFRQLMPERGEAVARMLTGCFQCIRRGIFDVASDFERAAGRPPKSVREMMRDCALIAP